MSRIRIDIDQLATALTDHDFDWVLDLQTGHVLMEEWLRDPDLRAENGLDLPGEDAGEDELDDFDPLESDRFIAIEAIESHESFRWMERFADAQEDRVRERLLDALDRPRPFRRFRDALTELPAVREAWFRYEDEQLREEAKAWLRSLEIDAELVDPRQPAPGEPE